MVSSPFKGEVGRGMGEEEHPCVLLLDPVVYRQQRRG